MPKTLLIHGVSEEAVRIFKARAVIAGMNHRDFLAFLVDAHYPDANMEEAMRGEAQAGEESPQRGKGAKGRGRRT